MIEQCDAEEPCERAVEIGAMAIRGILRYPNENGPSEKLPIVADCP